MTLMPTPASTSFIADPPLPPLNATRNAPHTFGYVTVKSRLPVILSKTIDTLARHLHEHIQEATRAEQAKEILAKLSQLRYELQCNKPILAKEHIVPLPSANCAQDQTLDRDTAQWRDALVRLEEKGINTWFEAPWLLIECLLYRRIAQSFALHGWWFEDYDWFGEQKRAAFWASTKDILAVSKHWNQVRDEKSPSVHDEFPEFLQYSLWGNQVDLSMHACQSDDHIKATKHEDNHSARDFIMVNHSESIWNYLSSMKEQRQQQSRVIHLILDNSGAELFMDLCLADWLISRQLATKIVFHTKSYPWFISDAMEHDIYWMIKEALPALVAKQGAQDPQVFEMTAMHNRWLQNLKDQHWEIHAHPFWNSFTAHWNLQSCAPELHERMSTADSILWIFKGDLNYRKLVYDCEWPFTTPFRDALGPMKDWTVPIVALRTCKADVVVGLAPGQSDELDAKYGKPEGDQGWLVTGRFAVLQFSGEH